MRRDRPHPLAAILLYAVAALFAAPLVCLILATFKPAEQFVSEPHALLPSRWTMHNYTETWGAMPMGLYARNSLRIAIGSVVGSLFSCALAAYAFSRLRWPGRDLVFALVLVSLLLPWHVTMLSRFWLLRELGLYNTLAALVVPTFFGDAFFIFLLRQFFIAIPEELSEAARLDGCGEWGVLWRVVLPLSLPALSTVALLQFVACWNDFQSPLLLLSDPNRFPIAYGLERFQSAYGSQTHLLLTAAVIMMAPVVVVFLFAERSFLKGALTSGLKG